MTAETAIRCPRCGAQCVPEKRDDSTEWIVCPDDDCTPASVLDRLLPGDLL